MDRPYPPTAWKALGGALERRRWQLGYGHRERGRFARECSSPLSEKTLARIERGERDAYPPATIATVEALYQLPPGAVGRYLDACAAGQAPGLEVTAPGPDSARYPDPRLQALFDSLPSKTPELPWGFSDEEKDGIITHAMGILAQRERKGA